MQPLRRLIALLLPVVLLCLAFPALAQTPLGDSELIEKENVVEIANGKGWAPANVGDKIPLRQRLRTREDSRAGVLFTDQSVLRLNELTTMEVLPPQQSSDKPTLELA